MKAGAERLSGILREQRNEMVAGVACVIERGCFSFFLMGKKKKRIIGWNLEILNI